jgi:hypothetical protein
MQLGVAMGKVESARVFSSISHANLQRLDALAKEQNCSRSALLADALDTFLNGGDGASIAELQQLRMKIEQLSINAQHYEDTIKQDQQQITFLQSQVAQLIQNLSQLALPNGTEKQKRWWHFW